MKKIVTILTACLVLASCAKFTDLKPKLRRKPDLRPHAQP